MAQHNHKAEETDPAIWVILRAGEDVRPRLRVLHHTPYVAQLIAQGREPASPPHRRWNDYAGPVHAYESGAPMPKGATRKIV